MLKTCWMIIKTVYIFPVCKTKVIKWFNYGDIWLHEYQKLCEFAHFSDIKTPTNIEQWWILIFLKHLLKITDSCLSLLYRQTYTCTCHICCPLNLVLEEEDMNKDLNSINLCNLKQNHVQEMKQVGQKKKNSQLV